MSTCTPQGRSSHRHRRAAADLQPLPKSRLRRFQHCRQRQTEPLLHAQSVPRFNPSLQAKREILRERHQFLQLPPHFHNEVIKFRLEIILNAVTEQRREPPKHHNCVPVREP